MPNKYLDILKKYWGYDAFRALQEDIIASVGAGKDTLGLMPTGGGKSITFQVPALSMEGVCIVVTPLIALMKDQVENLMKKGIRAAAIHTGMTHRKILTTLDNAVFEGCKFLYVSPERIGTEIFQVKLAQMNVCLIAVDEAHCISQWGYDFRPSYLKIADIRQIVPDVPILALTATATSDVVQDIQQQLKFRENNVFQKSFERKNVAYVVRAREDKLQQLLNILKNVPGTSIVYVRNRRKTKEIADFLNKKGIKAAHFHAGLSNKIKDVRQSQWKNDEIRVIVSTNAFGMGIDKPDVRTVIHIDLPDSLEAYFQEAGRAGRDEKKSYAVLIFNQTDVAMLKKRIADTFPPKENIIKVYDRLAHYYTIALGYGADSTFVFDLADFSKVFKLPMLPTYNAIKILEHAGYVSLTDEQDSVAMVLFTVDKDELYETKFTPEQDRLIHLLLRSYTGLFTDLSAIHEETLCDRLCWKQDYLYSQLVMLAKMRIIKYIPRRKTPFLTFIRDRVKQQDLYIPKTSYEVRKERYINRIAAMVGYAREDKQCRSRILLHYFGQENVPRCGICDVCLHKTETELTDEDFKRIELEILKVLTVSEANLNEIVQQVPYKEKRIIDVLRIMQDHSQIAVSNEMKFYVKA